MKTQDALKVLREYYDKSTPTKDDEFLFTEALGYLIEEPKDPKYMTELAWYYGSKKRFDIEIKYLEMAAEYGYIPAIEELGYMWYYGQHGEKDYKKAFEYFSKGAEGDSDQMGSLWCRYKLADMYRFGCGVEQDEKKYRQMIEEAYEKVRNPRRLNDPYPEIAYRLACIRAEEGKNETAIDLLKKSKRFMAERLSVEAFWGHIEVMGRIVRKLYELTEFDIQTATFYDLFYLTKEPCNLSFKYYDRKYKIEIKKDEEENNEKTAICFEGKWYRSFEEFCEKAKIENEKITVVYDEIYDPEVLP
ncbi:MAG: sel1 repeat family protein [Lachnospiraceae bacterium]|nr:sel1 repeat family protein [Lachnospiraceae bacterium]